MIRIIIMLSSTFVATLFSATLMAADTLPLAGIQKPSPTPIMETTLSTTNGGAECMSFNDSTATGWNAGEICLAPDINTSTKIISAPLSSAPRVANLMEIQEIELASTPGAECISGGGSTQATGSTVGICIASDLTTSETDIQHFSFKNGLPATGLQFLQATFGDGSTQTVSSPITRECISPDGSLSPPTDGNENSSGFCLISSIKKSISDLSVFSIANALPMVGMQFLQVKFADSSSLGGSSLSSNTECLSIGGSTAKTNGEAGGFCLASDLSTSTVKSANFSIAHNSPVTDLQFLQVTFKDNSATTGLFAAAGFGAPIGAECISIDGSIAVTGNPEGFCLVSDLIEPAGFSAISTANDLPVSGLQFLQVKFTDGSSSGGLPPSPGLGAPIGTECVSADGSIAATENIDGFCLVSDLINPTTGLANFTIANDLPVMSWEFLQVPSEDAIPVRGSTHGAPVGVVVADFIPLAFDLRTPSSNNLTLRSALADIIGIGSQKRYFHLSDQTNGMEAYSTTYWRKYPHLGLWVGR